MNAISIENSAVFKISQLASLPGTLLIPCIPTGDKGTSFDGHIEVYSDTSLRKSSRLGSVKVQVKGTSVKNFSSLQTKFSKLELEDVRNYYSEDGVLFFVCEVDANGDVAIFAKPLLALDLHSMIKKFGHQRTMTINLHYVKDQNELISICQYFLKEKKRQPSGLVGKQTFHTKKFDKYTVSTVSFSSDNDSRPILGTDMYFYGETEGIEFPIGIIKLETLGTKGVTDIEIDGTNITYSYRINDTLDITEILLENSFSISFKHKEEKAKFNILKFHSLESYWKVFLLLDKINKESTLTMFEGDIDFSDLKWTDGDTNRIENGLSWLKRMTRLYDKIGIPYDYVSNSNENELSEFLPVLYEAFIEENYNALLKTFPAGPGMLYIRLGKDLILTFYSPTEKEKLQSVSGDKFKKHKISIKSDQSFSEFIVSPFIIVDPKELLSAANVSLELVEKTFHPDSHVYNTDTFDITNQFCLDCLLAYDSNKNEQYLTLTNTIYRNILESGLEESEFNISSINYYQTIIRKDLVLTEDNLRHLIKIKEDPVNIEHTTLRLCCNILLNNRVESQVLYDKLIDEDKKAFVTFPIFHLYEKLVID